MKKANMLSVYRSENMATGEGVDIQISGFTEAELARAYETDEDFRHAVYQAATGVLGALRVYNAKHDHAEIEAVHNRKLSFMNSLEKAGFSVLYVEELSPTGYSSMDEFRYRKYMFTTDAGHFIITDSRSGPQIDWSRASVDAKVLANSKDGELSWRWDGKSCYSANNDPETLLRVLTLLRSTLTPFR